MRLVCAKINNVDVLIKELFSYGLANVVSSFFLGFPGSVALSRCVILDGIGAKTQVLEVFLYILM